MAVVLPCPLSDPWCGQGAAAARAVEKQGLVNLKMTTGAPQDTAGVVQVLSQYAQAGSQLVIAHSTWQDAAAQAAQRFPDANFATVGSQTLKNVAIYEEPIYQAAYLGGMLAAGITESKKLGGLAGQDVPLCHAELEAFEAGAKRIDPGISMIDTYIGDWNDIAKAKQATEAQVGQGADVFIACGGAPANGMLQAIKGRNLSGFGYVGDMSAQAPKNTVGSIIYNLEPYFRAMVKDVQSNTFRPGKTYDIGLAQGGVALKLNDRYSVKKIPEDVMRQMRQVEQQIRSGKFKVPYVPSSEGSGNQSQ
jgi:basic membrane lipoprotein Med (substrate-binding protein (PBP1-ABC) superfamily)